MRAELRSVVSVHSSSVSTAHYSRAKHLCFISSDLFSASTPSPAELSSLKSSRMRHSPDFKFSPGPQVQIPPRWSYQEELGLGGLAAETLSTGADAGPLCSKGPGGSLCWGAAGSGATLGVFLMTTSSLELAGQGEHTLRSLYGHLLLS